MPLKILYAEDQRSIREIFETLLKRRGHEVVMAENGHVLLETLKVGKFDLVLTDNDMPEMTGIQALRAIRADPRFESLPVVVFSAGQVKEAVEKAGGIYMDKWGSREGLYAVIDKLMSA